MTKVLLYDVSQSCICHFYFCFARCLTSYKNIAIWRLRPTWSYTSRWKNINTYVTWLQIFSEICYFWDCLWLDIALSNFRVFTRISTVQFEMPSNMLYSHQPLLQYQSNNTLENGRARLSGVTTHARTCRELASLCSYVVPFCGVSPLHSHHCRDHALSW